MLCCPEIRRWLPMMGTLGVIALVAVALIYQNRSTGDANVQAQPAQAAVMNLWGGSISRNPVNLTDRNIPDEWDTDPTAPKNILWSIDLGSKAYGGPIIAGGKIFMGTNNNKPRDPAIKGDKGVMMVFEESTGKFLYQLVFDKLAAGRVQDWPEEGICSAPVVEGDRFYFVNNRAEVLSCNTADGKINWKFDMIGKLGVFPHNLATCSPLIVGDTLFVITSNGVDEGHINVPAPRAPSFIAIDKNKGEVLWSSNLPSIQLVEKPDPNLNLKQLVDMGLVLMHGQWSNPVYSEAGGKPQIIFPGGNGWLYSFDPKKGELLWKFDCNPKSYTYELGGKGKRNDFVSTPIVVGNYLYIGVGQDPEHNKGVGHLWCIDITKTPKNADKDLSPFSAKDDPNPKFDPRDEKNKDSAMVWHYGGFALEGSKRRFVYGRTMSTCCVHDGLLYASEYDGYVHCFDAKTGEKYWEHKMDSDTWCSPYYVDGKIYIGNEGGEVLVFKPGKEKKLLKTNQMAGDAPMVRATPVVVNGVLYVLSENPCKMYAIGKK